MKISTIPQLVTKLSAIITVALFTSQVQATKQSTEQAEEAMTPQEMREVLKQEEVEVISVYGKRSFLDLKINAIRKELDFFERFNELANVDEFKVKCRRETRPASHIKQHVCYPQYMLDMLAEQTLEAQVTGTGVNPTRKRIANQTRKKQEEHFAYVEELVKENPDLLKLLSI